MKKVDSYILIFLFLAVAILWQGLKPGYILNLDMIFTPDMSVITNPDGFLNFLPINYLLFWFSLIIPVWLVQKIILVFLFFIIGYFAYRFLPVGENKNIRLFSALIYLSNPFVYSRFLAGHWTHLTAYGFLPVFIHYLLALRENRNWQTCAKIFGSLFLINLFSIHFFIMTCLIFFVWILYFVADDICQKKFIELRTLIKNVCLFGSVFLIVSGYWLVPAFQRSAPAEQRFGVEHWQAFSAGGYKNIGTFLNVASLNGFWGERNPWAQYFLWPQDFVIFWFAFVVILCLVLLGLGNGLKNQKTRLVVVFLGVLGVSSLIFATGAGEAVFKPVNLWLYENVSFWSGFRDSQKFSGFLVLVYAVFAGLGLERVLNFIKTKKPYLENTFLSFVFIIPVLFGFLIWGGFHGQMKSVWYPASWFEAKTIIDNDKLDYKVLFLPWHGYLSLNFNNNLVTANPAKSFFGEKAVTSKSVELDEIYNQDVNQDYLTLDATITSSTLLAEEAVNYLIEQKIKYVVYFQDLKEADNLRYEFLNFGRIKPILTTKDLIMYKIGDN